LGKFDSERIVEAYEKAGTKYDESYFGKQGYEEWLSALCKNLPAHASVVDLGCGSGRAIDYLCKKGCSCTGVDLSATMLKLCIKNVPEAKLVKADFRKWIPKEKFDAVCSFFALIHISRKETWEMLGTIKHKMLKDDGFILLGLVKGEEEVLYPDFMNTGIRIWESGYKKKDVEEKLRKIGFRILKSRQDKFKDGNFTETQIFVMGKMR
jgi:cyclopropane fatty-acyl-phospholipid synthase-like methyltransferase